MIDIERLCQLASLRLDDAERARALEDLEAIVTMIDAMQRVPTDGVEPLAQPFADEQHLREDRVTEDDQRSALQTGAPHVRDGYYIVPRVVE